MSAYRPASLGGGRGALWRLGEAQWKSTRGIDELVLKLPILEADVKGLRQLLAEVKSNLDELRRDRDHLQRRAGPMPSRVEQPDWFCGRASAGGLSSFREASFDTRT